MTFKEFTNKTTDGLLNDSFRRSFLVLVLSSLLSLITLVAAVTHWIRDTETIKVFAIIATSVCVLSAAVFVLTAFVRKYANIWRHIFMVLLIFFFCYLCYDGGPDGFLHLWVLLIPAFSFITFGMFEGFITALPAFIAMEIFFWANDMALMKYSNLSVDFRLRMTLVYLVCLLLGFYAEMLRHIAAKRLRSFTENFKYASMHDSLTGLANQNLLAKYLDDTYQNRQKDTTLGCLFVDVDSFKNVNDTYGHLFGNVVLVKIGEILSSEKDCFVCRWGGDEFVVCAVNIQEDLLVRIGEKFRAAVSACTFKDFPDFHITVSVGAVVIPVDEKFNFDHVLDLADYANRTAKKKGKDNVSLAEKRS